MPETQQNKINDLLKDLSDKIDELIEKAKKIELDDLKKAFHQQIDELKKNRDELKKELDRITESEAFIDLEHRITSAAEKVGEAIETLFKKR